MFSVNCRKHSTVRKLNNFGFKKQLTNLKIQHKRKRFSRIEKEMKMEEKEPTIKELLEEMKEEMKKEMKEEMKKLQTDLTNKIDDVKQRVRQLGFRDDLNKIKRRIKRTRRRVKSLSDRFDALQLNRNVANQAPVVRAPVNNEGDNGVVDVHLDDDDNLGGHNGGGLN
ncbi:unnamed protein product [Meloidogyne enterolobii]|uniref:Uncharacterized protein n=1 Tax=Meloidogyne enterolobii TaxID=390850 RepID=A0ACB1ACL3_MELEN